MFLSNLAQIYTRYSKMDVKLAYKRSIPQSSEAYFTSCKDATKHALILLCMFCWKNCNKHCHAQR